MTKWMLAMTLGAFAASAGSPTTQSTSDDQIGVGTCSYTCSTTEVTYLNRTQCRAACNGTCVVEVC